MKLRRLLGRMRGSEIARGFSAFAAMDVMNLVVGISTRFLLGGLLGASALGAFSLILAVAAVVQQFFDLRIGGFTTRYVTESLTKRDNATTGALIKLSYIIDLGIGAAAFVVITLGASWILNTFYDQPQLVLSLRVYALAVLAATIQDTSAGVLRATARYAWLSISTISVRTFELILIGLLAWATRDLMTIFVVLVVKETVASVVGLLLVRRAVREHDVRVMRSDLSLLRPKRKEFVRFLFNTNLDTYAAVIASKLDVLVLGRYISLAELGVYRLAVSAAAPVMLFVSPLRSTLLQVFVRVRDAGKAATVRIVERTTMYAAIMTTIASIAIVLLGDLILSWVLSEEIKVQGLLILLTGRYIIEAAVVWAVPLLVALDQVRVVGRRAVLYIVLYPALLVPSVRLWGTMGAAGALVVVTAAVHGYTGITAARELRKL